MVMLGFFSERKSLIELLRPQRSYTLSGDARLCALSIGILMVSPIGIYLQFYQHEQ